MIEGYEAIVVGLAWGLAIALLLRYLFVRQVLHRTFRITEELCLQHQQEVVTLFTDTSERIRASSRDIIEQIKQHGEENRERIGQYAEEAIKHINKEAEDR